MESVRKSTTVIEFNSIQEATSLEQVMHFSLSSSLDGGRQNKNDERC
jgi:hypothetical protein